MKKFTKLLSLLFFLQVVWSSSIYGQVYQNNFSTGINGPAGIIDPGLYSTNWTSSTGTVLALNGGELKANGFSSSNSSITLTVKVKCGYELDISSITFNHRRSSNDGPPVVNVNVDGGASTPASPPVSGTPTLVTVNSGITQNVVGQVTITLNLTSITVPGTGDYFIDDFTINGTATKDVILTDPPTPLNQCAGTSASFTTSQSSNISGGLLANPVFHWQKTALDIPFAGGTYTINPIAAGDAGTYRAYVTYDVCNTVGTNTADAAGEFTADAILTVNPLPTATISGTIAVCQNATAPNITFTGAAGTAPYTFIYKVNGGADQTVTTVSGNSVTVPQPTGTAGPFAYTLVSVADVNCSQNQSGSATITVNALPNASFTGLPTSICVNAAAVTLTPTTGGGTFSGTGISGATFNPATASVGGPYTITYSITDGNTCTNTSTASVTVNALPNASFTGLPTSICVNAAAVTLTPTTGGGTFSGTGISGNTFNPATAGVGGPYTITYTITDGNNCTNTSTAPVTVNALPVISFTGNGSPTSFKICSGAPITISTGGYTTFSWSVTNGSGNVTNTIGSSNSTSIVVTPTSISTNTTETITVSYTATDGNNCTTSSSVVVTVNPSPTAGTLTPSIASPVPGLCEGNQTINFTGTPSGGLGLLQNIWTSAPSGVLSLAPTNATAIGTSGTTNGVNPTPYSDATVTYRVLDQSTGCSSPSLTSVVRVYNTPSTSVAGADQAKCSDGSFTLAGNAPTVGTGLWSIFGSANGASITTPTSNTSGVTGLTAGQSVTLHWTISNGPCTVSTDDVVLTNYVQPTASIATSGPIAVCNQLTNFTITANAPSVGTGVWSVTGSATIASSSGTSVTVTVTPGNTGTAVWTVTNGLASCSSSSSITITNSAPPATAVITSNPSIEQCVAGLFTVNAASPGAGTGLWTITNGGPGTIQSPTSTTTLVTGVTIPPLAASVTTALAWTTSSPGCPNFSTATINLINYAQPTTANAGVPLTNCSNPSFTLGATPTTIGTGQWTVVSQANGTVTGLPSSSAAAAVSLSRIVTAANSTATLRWSTTNGVCPVSTAEIVIRNDAPVTSSITASPTSQCNNAVFNITGSTPQFGSGVWTVSGGSASPTTTPITAITVTAPFVSGAASASATWTVTNNTCSSTSSVTVINYETPTATISTVSSVNCNQGPNFTVNAVAPAFGTGVWTVTGGGSLSSTSGTQATVTVNPGNAPNNVATVIWTVTNTLSGCSSSTSITITNYALPTASAAGPAQIKCAIGNFTLAGNTPSVGTGVWTVTSGTATITSSNLATTTVTGVPNGTSATLVWTISNGTCPPSSSSVVLTNNNPITVTLAPTPFPKMCPSGSAITLTPTITGGQGSGFYTTLAYNSPDVYSTLNQLFNLQSQATLTPGATPGTDIIVFTVVDNAGCSASTNFSAVVVPPLAPAVTGNLSICAAAPSTNLSTVLTAAANLGGSSSYSQYQWSITGNATLNTTAGTSVTVTAASAGTATVVFTVTDAMTGCSSSTSVVVTINANPTVSVASVTNISCFGGNNGAVSITPVGVSVITYAWSNSATTQNISSLTAGTYTVVITDGNGCKASTSATVTQPATAITATAAVTSPILCFGGSGSATVTPSGGTPGYTYFWSNETANQTATGLTVGTYTVTVADANLCTTTASVTITQPAALAFGTPTITDVSCNGGSNGAITIAATGGTGTKTYAILPNVGSQSPSGTFTGLTAQTYTVTVTDANTCSTSTMVIVGQPTALSVSATSTPALCNGGATGKAVAAGSGGTSPYTYSWSGGTADPMDPTNTAKRAGLAAATYTVTVTDAHSCTATNTVIVSEPAQLAAGLQAVGTYNGFNVACNGAATGVVQATAFFGTPPYTYTFTQGVANIDPTIRTGLLAGVPIYVSVTDANGCQASPYPAVVVLTQPAAALAVFAGITEPSCVPGQGISNNGSIGATASNGVGGYMYQLFDGTNTTLYQVSGTFNGLSAGTYTITAKDANGCTVSIPKTLTSQTPMLTVTANVNTALPTDDQACSGSSFTLNASSGFSSYAWSTTSLTGWTSATNSFVNSGQNVSGTVTQTPTMLPNMATQTTVVTYTVTASLSGCSTTASTTVTVNPLPFLTGVGSPDPTCKNAGAFGFIYTGNSNGANQITFTADNPGTPILVSPGLSPRTLTASPMRIDVIPSLPTGNSSLIYTVTNSTTGCVSPTSSYVVTVNLLSSVTAFTISANELCDGGPAITLNVTTDGALSGVVGAFPRTVRIEKTINSVVSTFDIIVADPGSGSIASNNTTVINQAGTYRVTGITDGATCAGSPTTGLPIRTLSDGRFTVTAPASNTTQVVYNGCSAILTVAASFNSTPSVGTLAYQWEVDPGTGFFANIGETNPSFTLPVTNSMNGYKYRCVVTGTGSSCGTVVKFSNVITLSVIAFPTTNAGPDQTAPGLTFTLAGSVAPSGTTGAWTVVSTNTTVTFASSANPTTTVTLADPGSTATLRWTITAPGGCSASDDVILTRAGIKLNATAFLEGPMNGGGTAMSSVLATNGLIPLTFNGESVSSASVFTANGIVDWVTVQIRVSGSPGSNTLLANGSRSALLKSNGQIVDLDGISPLSFPTIGTGTYNVAVLHRNHVAMRTSTGIAFTANATTSFNFTSGAVVGGKTKLGKRVLIAGDANNSQHVTAGDAAIYNTQSSLSGYRSADFNLSGVVTVGDLILYNLNTGGAPVFNLNQ